MGVLFLYKEKGLMAIQIEVNLYFIHFFFLIIFYIFPLFFSPSKGVLMVLVQYQGNSRSDQISWGYLICVWWQNANFESSLEGAFDQPECTSGPWYWLSRRCVHLGHPQAPQHTLQCQAKRLKWRQMPWVSATVLRLWWNKSMLKLAFRSAIGKLYSASVSKRQRSCLGDQSNEG